LSVVGATVSINNYSIYHPIHHPAVYPQNKFSKTAICNAENVIRAVGVAAAAAAAGAD